MNSTDYRLPRGVLPVDYDVALAASPRLMNFAGKLRITVTVQRPTDVVELHARDLVVSNVKAKAPGGGILARVVEHANRETVELHFGKSLSKGQHQITLHFAGTLNPSMHGLYLAQDGPERAIVSQCEATDARAIFPCFDEPDMKATLRWTVRTDAEWVVITNGELAGKQKVPDSPDVVHAFKRTRVIPTYLAAITIGKLAAGPAQKVAGIPCRVWAGEGKQGQTEFAQEVTARVLPWYQTYFGQKYNYEKLDQVAVPGFDAGAMENVGAIFYRQNLLLMTPGATSWQGQKRIAEVIAHEIAHQWFGNLVTMRWWDDLWLNEAFATWIAYKACDAWKPEWRMWDDYLESKEGALAADALVNTHPIYTPVKSPAEATELFDVITYEKGCGVLRMCESFLGADTFRQGIRRYQAAFKNANATGADLWNKLGEAADQPVGALMHSWITQPGFPLVTVSQRMQEGRTVLHLSQRRFFAGASHMQEDEASPQVWMIPLVVEYDLGNGPAQHRLMLQEHEGTFELPEAGHARWVYPNAGATGFYRLHLDDKTLDSLLKHGLPALAPGARMSLLEDQWALVRCGLSNVEQFMDVLAAFRAERDHAVLRTIVGRLHYLQEVLARPEDAPALARFARWLLQPQLEELTWDQEPEEQPPRAVRRALVVGALGEVGRDEAVLRQAARRVELEMRDPDSVEPNLAGVIIQLAALGGDAGLLGRYVDTYLARKRERAAPQLQARYLNALSQFERPEVVSRVLALCMNDTVPQEQLRSLLGPMLGRRASQKETWEFLKRNWQTIGPRVGSMGVARLVESTGSLPYALRGDVQTFFQQNPVQEAQRALQKALEAMTLRHDLVDREARRLSDWLKNAEYAA